MDGPLRLSRAQVRAIDRACIDAYGIPGIVLMENAARAARDAARALLADAGGRRVLIVCGGGNNGGDGYALARHLDNAGCDVTIAAAAPVETLAGDAATNAAICARMNVRLATATPELIAWAGADLIVDALFGTGLERPPRAEAAALIGAMNARGVPILAVDVPSGLDCDAGRPLGRYADCVRATATLTMVAEKLGFPAAGAWTGRVIVADIGCPRAVVARLARG